MSFISRVECSSLQTEGELVLLFLADILMLSGANLAIVVGNAQPDLVRWLEERLHDKEPSPLQGVPRLLRAKQKEAYGILEGLETFGYK